MPTRTKSHNQANSIPDNPRLNSTSSY